MPVRTRSDRLKALVLELYENTLNSNFHGSFLNKKE